MDSFDELIEFIDNEIDGAQYAIANCVPHDSPLEVIQKIRKKAIELKYAHYNKSSSSASSGSEDEPTER